MPKVGGKRKKARTHKETTENEETSTGQKIPKTFILKRGDIPNPLKNIIGDLREVMYPHTAMKMRESTKDKLKDYIQVGGGFGVTHMVVFSATTSSNYLRFIKLPDGPTLTFKIMNYSSHKDILSTQKKPRVFGRTLAAPLLIINGFTNVDQSQREDNDPTAHHYHLVNMMIQNMFPPLDLAKARTHNSKKAVLFNLNHESGLVDFRYYGIKVNQAGINKNIKQVLELKKIPNLKGYKDISEYILRENDYMSENDMEDILEDNSKSKDDKSSSKMTVKLYEIGPRMTLKLIKIEEGIMRGNVIYHRLVKKTTEEIENNRRKIKEKNKLREQAKQKQQEALDAKAAKKAKREELKKKKEFLDEKLDKGDKDEDGEGFNKEMEVRGKDEDEEEEEKATTKKKKAFDLSRGGFASDEEEEDEGEGDDEGENYDDEEVDDDEIDDLEAGDDEEEDIEEGDYNDEDDEEEDDM